MRFQRESCCSQSIHLPSRSTSSVSWDTASETFRHDWPANYRQRRSDTRQHARHAYRGRAATEVWPRPRSVRRRWRASVSRDSSARGRQQPRPILRRQSDATKRAANRVRFSQLRKPVRDLVAHIGTKGGAIAAADALRDDHLFVDKPRFPHEIPRRWAASDSQNNWTSGRGSVATTHGRRRAAGGRSIDCNPVGRACDRRDAARVGAHGLRDNGRSQGSHAGPARWPPAGRHRHRHRHRVSGRRPHGADDSTCFAAGRSCAIIAGQLRRRPGDDKRPPAARRGVGDAPLLNISSSMVS